MKPERERNASLIAYGEIKGRIEQELDWLRSEYEAPEEPKDTAA